MLGGTHKHKNQDKKSFSLANLFGALTLRDKSPAPLPLKKDITYLPEDIFNILLSYIIKDSDLLPHLRLVSTRFKMAIEKFLIARFNKMQRADERYLRDLALNPAILAQENEITYLLMHENDIVSITRKNRNLVRRNHPRVLKCFVLLKNRSRDRQNVAEFFFLESTLDQLNTLIIEARIEETKYQCIRASFRGLNYQDIFFTTFSCDSCFLTRFPAPVLLTPKHQSFWRKIKILNMAFNQLKRLPSTIWTLINLECFGLRKNNLREIPPEIGSLTNLRHLGVTENLLEDLPSEIEKLQSLLTLHLSKNQLTYLPPSVAKLPQLTHLYINFNKLSFLPKTLKDDILRDNERNPLSQVEVLVTQDSQDLPLKSCLSYYMTP